MSGKATIDVNKTRELNVLIEKLTRSGDKSLNSGQLQAVYDICNLGSGYVKQAYSQLYSTLGEKHSEVRYSTVQLYDQLFLKYNDFRDMVITELDVFFKLTMGIRNKEPLPPPVKVAGDLTRLAISSFYSWFCKFGKGIPSLRMAHKYLQNIEKVDFTSMEIVDPKVRAKREEDEKRLMKLNREKLRRANDEMDELQREINSSLTSLESCFSLILPTPEDFGIDNGSSGSVESADDTDMRLFGVLSSKQELQLNLKPETKLAIKEDEENSVILENAKGLFRVISNKFLPKTKAWIHLITKAEGGPHLLKKALGQKENLEKAIAKYNRLDIKWLNEDEVSTDSELEEVPNADLPVKSYAEDSFSLLDEAKLSVQKGKKPGRSAKSTANEPSTSAEVDPSIARKKKLLEIAPKLPYDVDLYHWEDEKLPTPTMMPVNCEGHRFWSATADDQLCSEVPVPGGSATLRSRVIEFTGVFEPVTRACNAPLTSGKLCPRKDRFKCPFHGIIVARDELGNIIDKNDEEIVAKSKPQSNVPDWQDPQLLAEIKASTGVDLKMPEKGKKKRKKKYPGLTDIKSAADTSKNRIAKKVFNKASLKRVGQTLDKLDHKRFRDKYGDQFNYVHNTT